MGTQFCIPVEILCYLNSTFFFPGSGKKKAAKRNQPKTVDMIIEAIENLGERKGSSYQAIKAYILQNFKTVRPDMIRSMMRRALRKGLEQSTFTRPKGQANNQVSFKESLVLFYWTMVFCGFKFLAAPLL